MKQKLIFVLIVLLFSNSNNTNAQDHSEQAIVRQPKVKLKVLKRESKARIESSLISKKIIQLEWLNDRPKVLLVQNEREGHFFVTLEGKYSREGWSLISNKMKITRDENHEFKITQEITENNPEVFLTAIGPQGEIEQDVVEIADVDWKLQAELIEYFPVKRLFFSPGLGIGSINYRETGIGSYNTNVLTGKISGTYLLFPPHWDVGLSTYFTLFQFTRSLPIKTIFFGMNGRLGYILTDLRSPWRITIYGGYYYASVFANPNELGFEGMNGPQIFPTIKRSLKRNRAVSGYVKYSPISKNMGLYDLHSREFAVGFAYSRMVGKSFRTLSFTFDYANLNLKDVDANLNPIQFISNSITLGCSYGF